MRSADELFRNFITQAGAMTDLQIWTFSILGTVFIAYFFTVIIQRTMDPRIRLSLSFFFLCTGSFFFNLAGRQITGYYNHFTTTTIINGIIMGIAGLICVVYFYIVNKENRKKTHHEINE